MAVIALITEQDIEHFVAPKIQATEEQVMLHKVDQVATPILTDLARVEAQSRGITQAVPLLDSDGIDRVMPGLINQYGGAKVFGGGIRPMAKMRTPDRSNDAGENAVPVAFGFAQVVERLTGCCDSVCVGRFGGGWPRTARRWW